MRDHGVECFTYELRLNQFGILVLPANHKMFLDQYPAWMVFSQPIWLHLRSSVRRFREGVAFRMTYLYLVMMARSSSIRSHIRASYGDTAV